MHDAIDDFGHAIALKPDYIDAFYNRASTLDQDGQYEKAIADFDQVLKLRPNDAAAFANRCWTRAVLGDALNAAMDDCNQALRLNAEKDFVFDARGFVKLRMGAYREAIADYGVALQRNSNLPSALFGRGVAELRLGDAGRGQADIAAAEALQPGTAKHFAKYGIVP